MAYINKEEVKEKAVKLKAVAVKHGVKISVAGSNSSTLAVTILSGGIDFYADGVNRDKDFDYDNYHMQINAYWCHAYYTGKSQQLFADLLEVMKEGHYDHSDAMTDSFHCSWYNQIQVGKWNKSYVLEVK